MSIMVRSLIVVVILFPLGMRASDVDSLKKAIDKDQPQNVLDIVKKAPNLLQEQITVLKHQYFPFQYAFVKGSWGSAEKLLDTYSLDELGARESLVNPGVSPRGVLEPQGSVIHIAAHRGKIELLKKLINLGVDPMQQAPTTGETPLHIAAHRGYKDIVEFLLSRDQVKNNINVEDNRGNTPLKVAQNQERKEIESILKRHGASEKPQELKQRSEKVSTPTPPPIRQPAKADSDNLTQLKQAIENDNADEVVQLIENTSLTLNTELEYIPSIVVNVLQAAVLRGAYNVVDELLQKYNLRQLQAKDTFRYVISMRAIDFAYVQVVHVSARNGNRDILKRLVEAGLNPMARVEEYGYTPLHIAAYFGHQQVVEYLVTLEVVKNNINAQTEDKKLLPGKTALDIAYQQNRAQIVQLLEKYGAQYNEYKEEQQKRGEKGAYATQQTVQTIQEHLRNLAKQLQGLYNTVKS